MTRADGTLTATWPSVDGATSYHVTFSTDGGASWSLAEINHPATPDTTAITIDYADNTETYIIAVRARNAQGLWGGWRNSPPADPYTPDQPPDPPDSITVTRAYGTVTATWPSATHATAYHVTYSTDGGNSWSLAAFDHPATPDTTAITIDYADNTKTYIVGVRGKNADDLWGGWRNSPPADPYTPQPTPAPPSSVTVTRAYGGLRHRHRHLALRHPRHRLSRHLQH